MTTSASPSSELHIPPVVDIGSVESFHDLLLQEIEQKGSLHLNGQNVERITTSGLQLLFSALQTARQKNLAYSLNNPSEPLVNALQDLGFEPVLKN